MGKSNSGGLLVVALVSAVSGAVGGYLSSRSGSPSETSAAKDKPRPAKEEGSTETAPLGVEMSQRSESQRILALERKVSLLTAALSRGDQTFKGDTGDTSAGALDEVDVADPVFEAAVLDIMDRETERKDDERKTRRSELIEARGRQFSSQLSETLGLDDDQKERIAKVVTDHFNRFRETRSDDATDRPVTRREWQQKMEELNKRALEDLRGILSASQFDAYEKLDPDDQIGFGWGRARTGTDGPRRQTQPRDAQRSAE